MAVSNNKDFCNSCRYFSAGERIGICKRYPTHINKSKDDWCGEFFSEPTQINPFLYSVSITDGKRKAGRPKKYA
jgi:hypothetical protein